MSVNILLVLLGMTCMHMMTAAVGANKQVCYNTSRYVLCYSVISVSCYQHNSYVYVAM